MNMNNNHARCGTKKVRKIGRWKGEGFTQQMQAEAEQHMYVDTGADMRTLHRVKWYAIKVAICRQQWLKSRLRRRVRICPMCDVHTSFQIVGTSTTKLLSQTALVRPVTVEDCQTGSNIF